MQVDHIKYLLVGGLAFAFDGGTFFVLTRALGQPIFVANLTGLILGFLVSFVGNRLFVFGSTRENSHFSPLLQVIIYGILLTLNTFISYGIIKLLGLAGVNSIVGKAIAMMFIVVWNFLIYQKIIFRRFREDNNFGDLLTCIRTYDSGSF